MDSPSCAIAAQELLNYPFGDIRKKLPTQRIFHNWHVPDMVMAVGIQHAGFRMGAFPLRISRE